MSFAANAVLSNSFFEIYIKEMCFCVEGVFKELMKLFFLCCFWYKALDFAAVGMVTEEHTADNGLNNTSWYHPEKVWTLWQEGKTLTSWPHPSAMGQVLNFHLLNSKHYSSCESQASCWKGKPWLLIGSWTPHMFHSLPDFFIFFFLFPEAGYEHFVFLAYS